MFGQFWLYDSWISVSGGIKIGCFYLFFLYLLSYYVKPVHIYHTEHPNYEGMMLHYFLMKF